MSGEGYKDRTFYDWLGAQRPRRDDVGRFAQEAWAESAFPRNVANEDDLVNYMEGRGAHEDAIETAREAWEEFGSEATRFTPSDEVADWDDEVDERRP
jgi:uncharacterized protein YozE (UPF0346 family)